MPRRKSKDVWEFGDFQTPDRLAVSVCGLLKRAGIGPGSILEPTCGRGSFVGAAVEAFPAAHVIGVDLNTEHLAVARERLASEIAAGRVELRTGDFFHFDWDALLANGRDPWLILGNPPWVTSAELGVLSSTNLPEKSNFYGRSGIEAVTGKSNFDISEWMLLRYVDWLGRRGGCVAVLVKTAVARKLLVHVWKERSPVKSASIYSIDAMQHFGAAVDACLFVLILDPDARSSDCSVFEGLAATSPIRTFGFHDGFLVADVAAYARWRHLGGQEQHYLWRSGIKHDCSKVMELEATNGHLRNGFGEDVAVEDTLLFPMLKSSDVNRNDGGRDRFMVVPQRAPGEDTRAIRAVAPLTWAYLQRHAPLLGRRASAIYRNRPPFSIFGVGDYSFAPWKVAISGFYKSLRFVPVGPIGDRPTVFDDTVYFLPCRSRAEADFLADLLNSDPAREFYGSMIFWTDKRPITSDILRRLDVGRLAAELGVFETYTSFVSQWDGQRSAVAQLSLMEPA